jgi:two-component system, LytTR family, response regulator
MIHLAANNDKLTIGFKNKVSIDTIVCLEAMTNYTKLYFQNGKTLLVSSTIKNFETLLYSYPFLRSHRKFLVNINFVDSYDDNNCSLVLKNKKTALVSRRNTKKIKQLFPLAN